jgi:FkbM family methyltransferase
MVTCVNKAASDTDVPLKFRDSGSHVDGNRGGSGVLPPASTLPSHEVAATSIDVLLRASGECLLLKIDVEGFEVYVLRGMRETAANNKIVMQIEIFDEQKSEVLPELMALGLRQIHAIHPDYYFTNMPADELGVF